MFESNPVQTISFEHLHSYFDLFHVLFQHSQYLNIIRMENTNLGWTQKYASCCTFSYQWVDGRPLQSHTLSKQHVQSCHTNSLWVSSHLQGPARALRKATGSTWGQETACLQGGGEFLTLYKRSSLTSCWSLVAMDSWTSRTAWGVTTHIGSRCACDAVVRHAWGHHLGSGQDCMGLTWLCCLCSWISPSNAGWLAGLHSGM